MSRHDRLTPSTSLRGPRSSFTGRLYGSLATSPRLVSGAVLSVCTILLFATDFAFAQSSGQLLNPLSSEFNSIPNFIAGFLRVIVMVALPIISLFIVYSGFLFVKAQGNEEGLQTAKRNFLYVIIGSILILGAWVIATLIGGTVTQLTNG